MTRRDSRRSGFTLVELMASLSLAGLLLVLAVGVVRSLSDGSERTTHDRIRDDKEANGDRLLRLLLRRAEAGADSVARFVGDETSVEFNSWCDMPGAWLERCRVRLGAIVHDEYTAISATLPGRMTEEYWRAPGAGAFRYFSTQATSDPWVKTWGSSVALPGALAVVIGEDTIVFGTGAR
jgi:prepilin-type N-terminal cleavage/methylation domain-containing protein